MLRKHDICLYPVPSKVQPFVERSSMEVIVKMTNPETGEDIGSKKSRIYNEVVKDAKFLVRQESAELYSIENVLEAGLSPATMMEGAFLRPDLTMLSRESAQALVDYALSLQDKPEVSPAPSSEPIKEPEKLDE